MSLFRTLAQFAQDAARQVQEGGQRLLQQGMLDRAAIVCALISYWPDKEASQAEIRKGIKGVHALTNGAFDMRTMETQIMGHIDTMKSGDDIGYADLHRKLRGVRDPNDAKFLVNMAVAVAKSDGGVGDSAFSDIEKAEVAAIARTLNLNPADFGL